MADTLQEVTTQQTLAAPASVTGVGLHLGIECTMTFHPAPPSTGVVFVRVDLSGQPAVQAHPSRVLPAAQAQRRTAIGAGTAEIHTIEHAMAALWGMGVDNVRIEINGPEVPGLDGSAQPFVEAITAVGLVSQNAPRKFIRVQEPIWIEGEHAALAVLPYPEFRLSYTLSYDHPMLKAQFASFDTNIGSSFLEGIAPARTFCLEREAAKLQELGLGQGANYDNTLVVGDHGVIQNELRFEDEFVRHKVLDLLGDLYLLGAHIKGHVIALKSGHGLNLQAVRQVMAQGTAEAATSLVADEVSQTTARQPTQHISAVPSAIPVNIDQPIEGPTLDITQIQKVLPHRYPFLLVDRILDLVPNQRAVGLKNVTMNEPFFQGHFPGRPVMPGVLMLEAMAQVAGVLILSKPEHQGSYVFFMSADKVKFRKPVGPGDQLIITTDVARFRGRTGHVTGKITVDDQVVMEARIGFAVMKAEPDKG